MAMLGITNLSKIPLRAVVFFGFVCAALSLFVGLRIWWRSCCSGITLSWGWRRPCGVVLPGLGAADFAGNYWRVCGVDPQLCAERPLVTEKERINF